ncbi:MAG: hypothetical protein ACL93V_09810 [Candidatus Electrothrix sp. YB6]
MFFDHLSLPKDFRAYATVPGSGIQFSAQLRDFDPTKRQVHISVLSTLASEVMQAEPDLTLSQAEALVKKALVLPDSLQLGISLREPNPVFSSLAFFRKASENEGWVTYKNNIVSLAREFQYSSPQPRRFLISLDQLHHPITGLETGLSDAVEAVRLETTDRIGFTPASNLDMNQLFDPPVIFLASPTSVGGQFLFGVAQGITGNVVGDVANGILGWAANQLGLNYGTTGQLQEISEQLSAVQQSLTQLQSEITDDSIEKKIKSLVSEFFPIIDINNGNPTGAQVTLVNSITATLTAIQNGSQPPLNQPVQTNINDLVAVIKAPDYQTILDDAELQLTGRTGIILGVQNIVLNQELGIDCPGNVLYFPWRQNRVIDRVLPVYQQFAYLQSATLNIYSEQAHNYLVYENPVDGINAILKNVASNIASQKAQRQLLPFRNSVEGITPDFENGVMWFDQIWEPDTYDNANANASSFTESVIMPDGSVVVYDDWHLPTYGEFLSLQARAAYCPTRDESISHNSFNAVPDYGATTTALPYLGFYNAEAFNDNGENGEHGDLWMSYYELLGDPSSSTGYQIYKDDYYEFRLNYEKTRDLTDHKKSDDKNPYCLARTFGPTVTVTPFAVSGASHPATAAPDGIAGTNFVLSEYAQYGVVTNIEILEPKTAQPVTYPISDGSPKTFTPPAGSMQFDANVTYEINIGGSFEVGYGSGKTKSFTNPSTSSSQTVSTATDSGGTGTYNAVRQLINWSISNSTGSMNLLNVPYASGIGIPLTSGTVTVTASLLGANADTVSGTYSYTVNAPEKTLTGLQITQRNQLYGGNNSEPASGSYSYYCTGFYSDGTVESLGDKVIWEVTPTPNSANAQIVILGGTATLKLNQPPEAQPTDYQLTIKATYQDKSDSTLIEISPLVASSDN